ncbi:IS110 family transposase [Rhizobium sp. IMFF44]|uniref:IS110 family transposase n=1 Tax=Rhizobium sp. IMFF44 TaxID=3342350 RepID=UPI0035B9E8A1
MKNTVIVGLDLAKSVFQVHGMDTDGAKTFNRKLRREEVRAFFQDLPTCVVAMEAGSACHFWAREISALGHRTLIIPGQHVKPFVKRDKTDAADAQAIAIAAMRPDMQSVPAKSTEQQAMTVLIKTRALFIRQRTRAFQALRGHLAEFGIITGTGTARLHRLLNELRAGAIEGIPSIVRDAILSIYEEIEALDTKVARFEKDLALLSKREDDTRRLLTIPGIGPITASTIKAYVPDATMFKSSRQFASWLGLAPRAHNSGGKSRSGRISKRGNPIIRALLFVSGMTLVRQAKTKASGAETWLTRLVGRRPYKVAAVAAANKIARVVWALLNSGDIFRAPTQA